MAYYALGFWLYVSPELAWNYCQNDRIFRKPSPQECAWNAITLRALDLPQTIYQFTMSHHIANARINLFRLEFRQDQVVR